MTKEELLEEVREKRKEIEFAKSHLFFNKKIDSKVYYVRKLNECYGINTTTGITLEQLKSAEKKVNDFLDKVEEKIRYHAITLTEEDELFAKINLKFEASPFINKNGEFSDYTMISKFQIFADGTLKEKLNSIDFYIINYKELVKKIKELGYEINVETPEEMLDDNINTLVEVTYDFTDINKDEKIDEEKPKYVKITDTLSLKLR